jgi:hypothetical protein
MEYQFYETMTVSNDSGSSSSGDGAKELEE